MAASNLQAQSTVTGGDNIRLTFPTFRIRGLGKKIHWEDDMAYDALKYYTVYLGCTANKDPWSNEGSSQKKVNRPVGNGNVDAFFSPLALGPLKPTTNHPLLLSGKFGVRLLLTWSYRILHRRDLRRKRWTAKTRRRGLSEVQLLAWWQKPEC